MATVDKLATELSVKQYDLDPDATTLTDVGWIDGRDVERLLVTFFRTVGTSDLTLKILANTASDGSGDEATVVTKTFTAGQPNAVGDKVILEASAEMVAAKSIDDSKAYRYLSANYSFATATDEGVMTYIIKPRYEYDGLTADVIST